jgi:hypothetical protein
MGLILKGEIKGEGDDDVERERESKRISLAEHQMLDDHKAVALLLMLELLLRA